MENGDVECRIKHMLSPKSSEKVQDEFWAQGKKIKIVLNVDALLCNEKCERDLFLV